MTMKKAFSYLLFASALVFPQLHAESWVAEATDVCVNLSPDMGVNDLKPLPLLIPKKQDGVFKDVKTPLSATAGNWYVVNIPIEIKAIGRKENDKGKNEKCPARFVDELKIKAYVLFENAQAKKSSETKGSNYFLLEKEITYVDIPMETVAKKGDGFDDKGSGYAKMSVGLFISPASALKLVDNPDKPEGKPKVVACAIAPTFKGTPCRGIPKRDAATKSPASYVSDPKLDKILIKSNQWWKGSTASHFATTSAQLLSIAETPWAASYAPTYPAVKPAYGAASLSSSSSSAGSAESADSSADASSASDSNE